MSEKLTPEEQAEIRQHLEGLDGWLENRTRRLLNHLETLEKENTELSTVKWYRESYERIQAERDTLRAQNDQYVETNADLIGQLGNMQADNESLRAQLEAATERYKTAERLCGGSFMAGVDSRSVDDEREIAALRARCEQLQRENEALVHGAEAGPTR